MNASESNFAPMDPVAQRAKALNMLLGTWDQALAEGCDPEAIANSAIYAALADLVDVYGEEVVSRMTEKLPERVSRGEFSMREGPMN